MNSVVEGEVEEADSASVQYLKAELARVQAKAKAQGYYYVEEERNE